MFVRGRQGLHVNFAHGKVEKAFGKHVLDQKLATRLYRGYVYFFAWGGGKCFGGGGNPLQHVSPMLR